jgi:hypothetical protein
VFALRHLLYLGGMHAEAEAPLEILRCRHVCTERCSQVIAADCLWKGAATCARSDAHR